MGYAGAATFNGVPGILSAENSHINEIKSRLMFYAFFCVVVAFAANIATLVMRLF